MYTMDLTGKHPNYAETNRVFRVFKYGQLINFEATVFLESIEVFDLSSGISTQKLVLGEDYIVPDEFENSCDNEKSKAMLMDTTFNKTLVSGIQMIKGVEQNSYYTISVNYQRLFPNQLLTAYFHNEPFQVTPDLIYDLVKNVEDLKIVQNRLQDNFTVESITQSAILELDPAKKYATNAIVDEEHTVNVNNHVYIIHPKCGSFFLDSVVVKHPATGTTLVKDKDYVIVGMDEARTKAALHTSPVYKFILITAAINDTVTVSYHAFGGDPTLDNYREMQRSLSNIVEYLKDAKTLTTTNLSQNEIISSVIERVERMEDKMRRLEGTPSYGDITTGKAILMKLFADTIGMHWYTIATLYKANGTGMKPSTADTFIFRLQSKESHFQFEAAVAVDLNNTANEKFNVSVLTDNYPRGFVPCEDYSEIDKIIKPQLRVVWSEGENVSGAYLQLGFELINMLEETICIEDMSGHESSWKLVDEVSTVTLPQDEDFILPDGISTWSSSLENCKQDSTLIPFKKGHLIWAGSQPMNRPTEGWSVFDVRQEQLLVDPSTNIKKFSKLRLDIEEKDGFQYPIDVPLTGGTDYLKGHASWTHQEKPVYLNAEIMRVNDEIHLRLNYDVTAGLESNELYIRDLVIFL